MKWFLFPQSPYLSTRWWHRLATVVFWVWAIAVVVWAYNELILKPQQTCLSIKYGPLAWGGKVDDIACGSDAFDYLAMSFRHEGLLVTAAVFALAAVSMYLLMLLPGLLYRLLLYIGKGKSWRGQPASTT